jgi:hypothetical protein
MKKLPEIIVICCITAGLLTSGITVTDQRSDYLTGLQHDTAEFIGFLKTDSFNLEIIPPSSGVHFFKNGILFLSNTKYEGKMLPKHVSFGSIDAYTAIVKDTSLGFHILFSPSASFSYPVEATTFSPDFKIMYFTRIAQKEKKEKIYRADFKPGSTAESEWVINETPLEFCTGNNIYTHPALSADGKMMIFASDIDAKSGGMDLFLVRREGEKWSVPENLGKTINSFKDECFPFLDSDNNLYYSSNGLPGNGGYDIYTCRFNGTMWDKPMNLSRRINSMDDDIAFSIDNTDGKSAFYTTRQKSGKGYMQLYKVTLTREAVDNNPLTISFVYNGKPVPKTEYIAMKPAEQAKPVDKEPAKNIPVIVKKEEPKKEEAKVVDKKPPAEPEPKAKAPEAKVVVIKSTTAIPDELKDVVVYRVQFLSTTKPRKESQIVVNGIAYKTYEYFYLEAYRYTIGEFTTLDPAKELQSTCRKSGYPQAFVAAFKNNTRSLDLTLFK